MKREELIQSIQMLHFPKEQFVIVGSGPMILHGIKESNDIDIVVSKELFEQCKKEGWDILDRTYPDKKGETYLRKGNIELYLDVNCGETQPTLEELMQRADVVEGIHFASLIDIIALKKSYNKDKHDKDIQKIKEYLHI